MTAIHDGADDDAEPPLVGRRLEASASFVLFEIANTQMALPIADVEEICEPGALTSLPRAPEHVLGLLNLRGEAVPVLDVASLFALPANQGRSTDLRQRLMIVATSELRAAVLCDRVRGVTEIRLAALATPTTVESLGLHEHVRSEIHDDGAVIAVLDAASMLRASRSRAP